MPWARSGPLTLALLLLCGEAGAIDLEKLVMPGELIQGHADVEGECGKCHRKFEKTGQNDLCLDCHKDVAQDLAEQEGFHGRASGVAGAECRTCHPDHRGRDADIVGLDPEAFDHGLTDYPLHGAHVRVRCESCHAADTAHREAAHDCIDCHRKDDAHAGRLGDACADCHDERAWVHTRFDHDATGYPLEGGHAQVACALCHPAQRYKDTPRDCNSCHQIGDPHMGRFGTDCARCHQPAGWDRLVFDHGRDTKFALEGRHADTRCESCHVEGLGVELDTTCVSCHAFDDEHAGRNGADCERCHGVESWSGALFDHDRATAFPLRGAHRNARCESCHTGTMGEQQVPTLCNQCHADDDVHRTHADTACGQCHGESDWVEGILFEHDITRFPLLGMHAGVSCDQCHLSPRFTEAPIGCIDCHGGDDIHERRLGTKCGLCHNPNAWEVWRFDHDTQTAFPLEGAHEEADCLACHSQPLGDGAPPRGCFACHANDDPHFGAYGPECGRCHGSASWRDVEQLR